jgi:Protein of unknown function (DUF3225)
MHSQNKLPEVKLVAISMPPASSVPPASATDSAAAITPAQVLAELKSAFDTYEDALVNNRVDVLDSLFWDSPHTLRFGARENLYSFDEIKAFRAARPGVGLAREILECRIVTFGTSTGVANITFRRANEPRVGRQSQTWVRFAQGWHVVSAHVSWMDE